MHVSVLIPLYNGVEFLAEALQSLCDQTWVHWEAHVGLNGHGDDGGEVGVLAKALAKMDPRIHVHIQGSPIRGKIASLHNMLDKWAHHEWIALLDADDRWHPTKLAEQFAALHGPARDAAVIGTWCQYIGTMSGSPTLPSEYIEPSLLGTVNPMINSSVLLHRSWCRWRYVEGGYGMEDYELWMRMVLAGGRLYNVGRILVDHRVHPTSAFNSQHQDPRFLQDRFRRSLKDSIWTKTPIL